MISVNKKSLVVALSILMILSSTAAILTITQAKGCQKILLYDNFEQGIMASQRWPLKTAGIGESTGGGVAPGGEWKLVDDGTGNNVFEARSAGGIRGTAAFTGDVDWTDYTVEVRTLTDDSYMGLIVHADLSGTTYYTCYVSPNSPGAQVELFKHTNGIWGRIGLASANKQPNIQANSWINLKVEISNTKSGTLIKIFYKNEGPNQRYPVSPQLQFLDTNSPYTSGRVGLIFYDVNDGNPHYEWFDDLVVTAPSNIGKVINVNEGDSIQQAINNAKYGDTIIVHEGIYSNQRIIVNKTLTILGNNATLEYTVDVPTVDVLGLSYAIKVQSDGVIISGLKILDTTPGKNLTSAIDTSVRWGTVIGNNVIKAQKWGVAGYGASNVEIRSNEITATTPIYFTIPRNIVVRNNNINAYAIFVQSPGFVTVGIRLAQNISGAEVENNEIYSVQNGIQLEKPSNVEVANNEIFAVKGNGIDGSSQSSNFVIMNNRIDAGRNGINLAMGNTNPVVSRNIVYSEYWGISLTSISEATVNNNEVYINANTESLAGGIVVFSSANNKFSKNTVKGDFFTGIFLAGSSNNAIDKNIVTGIYRDQDQGIRLFPGSNNNTVEKNVISNVHIPIDDQGTGNIIIP